MMKAETGMKIATAGLYTAAIAFALASAIGITDPSGATKTLEAQGFDAVKAGGLAPLQCGTGDLFHTKFTAKNSKGDEIGGVVCKGIFKGSTIRFD